MLTVYAPSLFHSAEERYEITIAERERLKVLERDHSQLVGKFFRVGRSFEPSIVLDDFLFLGDIRHATNRTMLDTCEISRSRHASERIDRHSRV